MSERRYNLAMKKLKIKLEKIRSDPFKNMGSVDMSIMVSVKCAIRWAVIMIVCIAVCTVACNKNADKTNLAKHRVDMATMPDEAMKLRLFKKVDATTPDKNVINVLRAIGISEAADTVIVHKNTTGDTL